MASGSFSLKRLSIFLLSTFANAFGDKIALSTWPSMLAGQHSAMLSDTACTWNIKGVVSDIFNENTRYFRDILDIYIYYRFMARLEYYR